MLKTDLYSAIKSEDSEALEYTRHVALNMTLKDPEIKFEDRSGSAFLQISIHYVYIFSLSSPHGTRTLSLT